MIPRTAPSRQCDIVMKGGVTSGVVYPLAVTELARAFRLKSVGGTSAGAIAAAAAAAAEHGRATGGFDEFERLPAWLGEKAPGSYNTNLFSLFQPQPKTRALFLVATAGLRARSFKWLAVILELLRQYWGWALLGAVPGMALLLDARRAGYLTIAVLIDGLLLVLVGLLLASGIVMGWSSTSALVGNFYGLCTGRGDPKRNDKAALSEWLTAYLNRLAGKNENDPPLTFGELWWPDVPAGSKGESHDHAVRLEMMTTCLSHSRPYRLPFRDSEQVHENSLFLFNPAEFRLIFPEHVVSWMESHPRSPARVDGLIPLPEPWNLPVVVATRMSLSFPLLLSMVPLYAIDYHAEGEPERAERCWFSDGGLCCNFPVHFFDAPLPRWPTFAINLGDTGPGERPDMRMVRSNNDGIREAWSRFSPGSPGKHLLRFLSLAMKASGGWNDAMVSRLPGQRDRIATVTLSAEEGGLNLDMPPARIIALAERGRQAGLEFVRRFATADPTIEMNWPNHRWIRLRTLLAALDELVAGVESACGNAEPGDQTYSDWVASSVKPPSYDWTSEDQRSVARHALANIRAAAQRWSSTEAGLAAGSPRPRPELRARPRT